MSEKYILFAQCLAYLPSELHAIYHGIMDTLNAANMIPNLARAHILTLPAERIANAVLELDPARMILNNQVTRALEEISLPENVTQQLALRSILIVQILGQQAPIPHTANRLTLLAQPSTNAESSLRVTVGHLSLGIVLDDESVVLQKPPNRTREADLASTPSPNTVVIELGNSLRGAVEFAHFRNTEPFAELLPDLTAESIARSYDAIVVAVIGRRGCGEQVPAQLADVQDTRGLGIMDIFPELGGGEFASQAERTGVAY